MNRHSEIVTTGPVSIETRVEADGAAARHFYGRVLGLPEGRSTGHPQRERRPLGRTPPQGRNTLLMQQVLADPKWADTLTGADGRALSPLFWTHVNPYGRFELDMNRHLDLDLTARDTVPVPRAPEGRPAAALG